MGHYSFTNKRDIICGVIYRQHNCPDKFLNYFDETLEKLSNSSKSIYVMTDANINLLRYETCKYAQSFLHILQANLQNRLLEVLMEEDDYVGIPFLIKKISK